jgi:RNA polymerase sigma-70 factor (ECF subfamily)
MTNAAQAEDLVSQVFEDHREAIFRLLLGMTREAAEAEDLTQETLLRAHAKLDTLQDESKLVPWLYRIATNLARDRFRQPSWKIRPESLESAEESVLPLADDAPRLDRAMEKKEMSGCVRRYLENLSDDYRNVILLHDVQGLTNPEIANLLGDSVGAVKIRLHRARAELRDALARGCSFSQDDEGITVCEPQSDAGDHSAS